MKIRRLVLTLLGWSAFSSFLIFVIRRKHPFYNEVNSILKELQVSIIWIFSIKTAKGEGNLQFSISMVVGGEGQVPKLFFFFED